MPYVAAESRYQSLPYQRCGRSGLLLPRISLGLWHNFAAVDAQETARQMIRRAFDLGITHFDLANNYGPPPGSAEETFGQVLAQDLRPYRDEIVISTKAGYGMWPGPYGDFGSRKYLVASLDQSLRRLGVDYVDIFYHHRPDPHTPLEETMAALDAVVRAGKALYVGLSNYDHERTRQAQTLLRGLGTPCLIHQPSYSILNRWVEPQLLGELERQGMGCIVFSPLAQGLLTNKYLESIPVDSRAAKPHGFLRPSQLDPATLAKIRGLDQLARARGQSLAQMAIAWVLRQPAVTSALIGASRVEQIDDCVRALSQLGFSGEELSKIDSIVSGGG
jgi:L-glyceraldehyde 3-phosphate reductase